MCHLADPTPELYSLSITAPLVELSLFRDHRNSGCSATVACPLEPKALEVQVVPLLSRPPNFVWEWLQLVAGNRSPL